MNKFYFIVIVIPIIVFGLGLSHIGFARTSQEGANPVVVELFTSQSCSSCPPADRALTALAKSQNVIALSCHVTYWNHLHWVDNLSHEFCTTRQRHYAAQMKSRRVYTPQMIVNGHTEFVGSNYNTALKAIKNAAPIKNIALRLDGNSLSINLPSLPDDAYTVTLFGRVPSQDTQIKRGENKGLNLQYTHAVAFKQVVGTWNGRQANKTVTLKKTADSYVVLVNSAKTGRILAAGALK